MLRVSRWRSNRKGLSWVGVSLRARDRLMGKKDRGRRKRRKRVWLPGAL